MRRAAKNAARSSSPSKANLLRHGHFCELCDARPGDGLQLQAEQREGQPSADCLTICLTLFGTN
jgi:hypothetical protein